MSRFGTVLIERLVRADLCGSILLRARVIVWHYRVPLADTSATPPNGTSGNLGLWMSQHARAWVMTSVRELVAADQEWKLSTLADGWGSTEVARLGEVIDAAELPGFVAERHGERAGLATFAERADGVEIITIQSLIEGRGIGRALMDRLLLHASGSNAPRLWLTTTNDNVRAFAFYQRWGMDFVRLVHGGVDVSRRVKPSIPFAGQGGVPLRHELEFELRMG